MSNNKGPEGCAPDDQRCEALVRAKRHGWSWMKEDHRCPRRVSQARGPISVCHVHARSKTMIPWEAHQEGV